MSFIFFVNKHDYHPLTFDFNASLNDSSQNFHQNLSSWIELGELTAAPLGVSICLVNFFCQKPNSQIV